ncbi:MAG: cupredoxin domain-containing protein [Patescibacteria group bacterium]|nr:cupredoxin domain-containing protein [Patescibacteria group bacterium]MCL5224250.1 cupredoxin domain-containing protein [Patescibacteria group bacterium]
MDEIMPSTPKSKWYIWVAIAVVVIAVAAGVYYYLGRPTAEQAGAKVTVTINSCSSISPQSAPLGIADTLVFQNNDKIAHTISIAGNELAVPSGGSVGMKASLLNYGPGSYSYTCDGTLIGDEINLIQTPGSAPANTTGFKTMYDTQASSTQVCIKNALGSEFTQTYGDTGYIPSSAAIVGVQRCLIPASVGVTAASSSSGSK